ncbi:hypothetical protein MGYG_07992 [Nannizzia gypsea CBS 118893]|uniref:Uncharacterized protein n=1 Tax=Arthroderma gypseum (strain ATCC MYA-4604 / CBS 118893) TaxID=535722 RepID=E4V4R5_ARTGP|nr:hypothetical protein MGYG_07992 [Nannizzia gypsea CBS 118893]EFR04989.1 hypothetical protein MGYG_07992 [Nannizzia gypsea CBS 118893]
MRVLLAFAFLASFASAAVESLHGPFTINSVVYGENMTLAGSNDEQIKFIGTTDSYWIIQSVARDAKPWHTIEKYSRITQQSHYINFKEHKAGEPATISTGAGSIFEFEYAGFAIFRFASIDHPDLKTKLYWTVKNNGTESQPDLYLALEPEGVGYQIFTVFNRPVIP